MLPPGQKLEELVLRQGHLDLFSGQRGAAKALAETTGHWVLTFDVAHHASENLLDPSVQDFLASLVEAAAFLSVGAGPVCASFSRAVRPPVRTKECPTGLADLTDNMREKVQVGNAMSQWLAAFIALVHAHGICWWVENPAGSYLWWQPEWVRLITTLGLRFFTTDYCRWGTPWRKRTRFLTNTSVAGETLLCQCERPHIQLVGYSKSRGCCLTKAAEAYPTGLCRFLAKVVAEELKPADRRQKFDVASCAKCCGRRIGEASHPGPRVRRVLPAVELDEVDTVTPATRLLQARALERYARWLSENLPADVLQHLWDSPLFQVSFLQSFGHWSFQRGEPMYLFRHLVVHYQKSAPAVRAQLAPAWDLLQRWEIVQPVQHRPPMPRQLLDAFLSLGLLWGWHRWVGVTALAFHGATRIGEPIKARRADLLLPADLCVDDNVSFLRVGAPKPGRRGRGRVQHARVSHASTVRLLVSVFGNLEPEAFLFSASPAAYRRRWDKIAEALQVPHSSQITPGGLRGGGAVHLYHTGTPIWDILWRLRLKQLSTLESYLQETAASGVLASLPAECREKVKSASSFLPFLLDALDKRPPDS